MDTQKEVRPSTTQCSKKNFDGLVLALVLLELESFIDYDDVLEEIIAGSVLNSLYRGPPGPVGLFK